MKKKIFLSLILVFILFIATGCGSKTNKKTDTNIDKQIVGDYVIYELIINGRSMKKEQLEKENEANKTFKLEVRKDKTATLYMQDNVIELTYNNTHFINKKKKNKKISYKYKNGKLRLNAKEGTILVFKRK